MSEVRGSSGARGNPPPRAALARVRPLDAEDGPGSTSDQPAQATQPLSATAPGGTQGRDLLIPGSSKGRAKNGRSVPSLADLMPPAAPSGRRAGGQHEKAGHHPGAGNDGKDDKGGKTVELTVRLPKAVRKQLKARATELGLSPEDAVARLVEVWLEG